MNICELCDRLRQVELSGGFANILKLEVAIATLATCYHVLHLGPAVHVRVTLSIAIQLRSWWPKPWLLQPMSTTILPPLSQTSVHQNSSQLLTFAFIDIGYLMIMSTFDTHTHTETETAGFNALNRQISYEVTSHSNAIACRSLPQVLSSERHMFKLFREGVMK